MSRRPMSIAARFASIVLLAMIGSPWIARAQIPPPIEPLWSSTLAPVDTMTCEWVHGAFLAAPKGGVAIVTSLGLHRVAEGGETLWQTTLCPGCGDPTPQWSGIHDVSIADNGDAWIAESQGSFLDPPFELFLHRIDDAGTVASSAGIAPSTHSAETRVLADAGGVTAMVAARSDVDQRTRMLWIRRDHGTPPVQREILLRNNPLGKTVNALYPAAGGGLLAALEHRVVPGCWPGHSCPDTPELTWLRLGADGTEQWRVDVDGFLPWPALQADGSAWLVRYDHGIAHVSAAGELSATVPVVGLAENEAIYAVHGPVAGHLLLVTEFGLHSVDLAGRVRASRAEPLAIFWRYPSDGNIAATTEGFLVPELIPSDCTLVELLDPRTLAVRRILRRGGACTAELARAVRLHTDGSVYVTTSDTNGDCSGDLHLLRFGLPGTPAGGLLFRNDFES